MAVEDEAKGEEQGGETSVRVGVRVVIKISLDPGILVTVIVVLETEGLTDDLECSARQCVLVTVVVVLKTEGLTGSLERSARRCALATLRFGSQVYSCGAVFQDTAEWEETTDFDVQAEHKDEIKSYNQCVTEKAEYRLLLGCGNLEARKATGMMFALLSS